MEVPLIKRKKLRLATCNVENVIDFEPLVEEIVKLKILIVCLQGYKKDVYEKMIRSFKSKGFSGSKDGSANNIIFSHKSCLSQERHFIPYVTSSQGKSICVNTYLIHDLKTNEFGTVPTKSVKICSSQLEHGGTGGGIRKTQIKELGKIFDSQDTVVILACDTNIPNWQIDLNSLTPGADWLDAWREKGTSDNESTNANTGDRMDRFWYRGDLKLKSYDLFFKDGSRNGVVVEFSLWD